MMSNGFIFPAFNFIIHKFRYLCLVELLKYLFVLNSTTDKNENKKKLARYAIDFYQVFKWLLITFLLIFQPTNTFFKYLSYYMISTNLYSYFYYHVWGGIFPQFGDYDYIKSRFLNTLLAVFYFILFYSYLYMSHFHEQINWPNGNIDFLNSFYLSISNTFTLTYGGFKPLTQNVRILFITELLNTFVFFTIIVSNSIPNPLGRN